MHPDPLQLDQILLFPPELPFARIEAALAGAGWQRDTRQPATAPLIPGEPEVASWREPGGRSVTYTLNPVVRLRVLDVAIATPGERGAIASALPIVADEAIEAALGAPDARRRLWGVFAAGEREAWWLAPKLAPLARDREPIVARAAAETAAKLAGIADARQRALAGMKLVEEMVAPLLRALAEPGGEALIQELRPQPADYALVFHADVAAPVMHAYDRLWRDPPKVDPGYEHPDLEVAASPAGMFRSPNEVSWRFPQGYRGVAPWLAPGRTWVRWRYLRRGETGGGIAFDGLVWLEGRWAWFPRPFRVIPDIVARARAGGAPS